MPLTGRIPSVLYTVERVVGTRRFNPYRPDKAKVESSILSCPTKKEEVSHAKLDDGN